MILPIGSDIRLTASDISALRILRCLPTAYKKREGVETLPYCLYQYKLLKPTRARNTRPYRLYQYKLLKFVGDGAPTSRFSPFTIRTHNNIIVRKYA